MSAGPLLRSLGPLSGRPMPAATSASTWLWGLGVDSSIFTLYSTRDGYNRRRSREEVVRAAAAISGQWQAPDGMLHREVPTVSGSINIMLLVVRCQGSGLTSMLWCDSRSS